MRKILIASALVASAIATPAFAGTGSAFSSEANCNAALTAGTATDYTPAVVSSRARVSTPMNGWGTVANAPARICVEERVRVNGQTQFAWVVIPGNALVQKDGQYADLRCFNEIRRISVPQVARRESDVPCPNCQQPAPQPQPSGEFIPAAAPARVQVAVAPAPQFALPQQTIGLGAFSQPSFAFAPTNVTYNQRSMTYSPSFTGVTNPPSGGGNDFGGQTQPPNGSGNDFGGVTNPSTGVPAPIPGPVTGGGSDVIPMPVPGPVFGGNSSGTIQGPIGGGQTIIGGPVVGSGGTTPVPAPVFGGNTSSTGSFGGFTSSSSSSVVNLPAPGAGTLTTINVVGGVPAPVGSAQPQLGFGGTTN